MPDAVAPSQLTKVLVCTDESPDSQGAVNAGMALARLSGCRIVLLQVLQYLQDYEFQQREGLLLPPQVAFDLAAAREEAVRARLEELQTAATKEGLEVEIRVHSSAAISTGILEEIEEMCPQLLITGRHGRTGLERLMVGSVAARVIGQSSVPVLVVPREAALDFKRLLVAMDGSPHSQAAWEQALLIAKDQGSTLIAASVSQSDRELKAAEEIVEKLEPLAKRESVSLEPLVLQGRPFEAIVRLARQKQADLIIMGSHGRTGLMRLLMGSVAERVIGQAPCAVLVVKGS
jgi:nucleotide-binding universal stress UspA family protein